MECFVLLPPSCLFQNKHLLLLVLRFPCICFGNFNFLSVPDILLNHVDFRALFADERGFSKFI